MRPNFCISGCAQWWPERTATPSRSRSVARSCACAPSTKKLTTAAFAGAVPKIRTPSADPVMLLGDIGEVEELRERARDGKRFLDGHLLEQPRQRGEVGVAAASRFLRQRAHALHAIEGRLAFLSPKRFAQQLPKQAHVVSQGFGQLVAHGGVV